MSNQDHLKTWQVKSSNLLHQTPWIEVKEDVCLADGKEITYTYTHRVDEGPVIIAREADGKLWLVRQYRHPIKKTIWQFPAEGKLPGESWQQAATRGLKEELHLQAEQYDDLGLFYPDPGGLEQQYHLYVAQKLIHLEQAETHQADGTVENLKQGSFSLEEIDQLIEQGEICDNWTLGALYLYQRYLRQ